MIGTVVRVGLTSLRRDRVALAMTFVLPVAFFSIFALVFGQQARRQTRPVRVAVVDEDGSEASRRLVGALEAEKGLRVVKAARPRAAPDDAPEVVLDPVRAEAMVRDGDLAVALLIPKGLGSSFGSFGGEGPSVSLLADVSDPIAPQIVQGLLQKAAFAAAPDLLARSGIEQFERHAGALTPEQRRAVEHWLPEIEAASKASGGSAPGGGEADGRGLSAGLVPVRTVDVLGGGKDDSLVAFYAAGVAVMFLLFSCSAAGGSLLEEAESGTLERVLASRLGMGRLLVGKWLTLVLLGALQVTVMFVWGALVFGLDLWSHLAGFVAMTSVTAAAAGGFGLVLATVCRSRAQLGGVSTIVILMMSALGGSMFPRFLMSETMQRLGLLTFNGWALDGYVKVFWRDAPLGELWPQLLVLSLLAGAFLAAARLLARRWERT